ncbi:MAG: polyphosphate polymerase domain-containing protein [Pirellulales bacterium]|nr:polyphosphate polymerase domain-containing protein [Pirellulales bacterium]
MIPPDAVQHSLDSLCPVSLAEIDAVALMNRVDTKYVLREDSLPELLDGLRESYRVLEVAGLRCSPYSTLYFDTPDDACYLAHHNGKGARVKYRSRRYDSSGATFFEVKERTNKGRTVKQRTELHEITEALDDASTSLAAAVRAATPLDPTMWTRFLRITLVATDFTERVTLDLRLQFSAGDRRVGIPGAAIAEIKQQRDSRNSAIRRRLREMRVTPMRVSKYCIGRALLDPTLKQNQFKRKLLALRAVLS